mgnify:CR=1 FL=1
MKIKTLAKWHKYYNQICQWFFVFIMFSIIAIFTTRFVNYATTWFVNDSTLTKTSMLTIFNIVNIFMGYVILLTIVLLPFCVLGKIFQFINLWTLGKLPFNLSYDKKFILFYLILREHKCKTLNLELEKIIHIYKKQSNVYQEFNENDFPCLNKLFRRFKKNKKGSLTSNNKSTVQNDLSKLNLYNSDEQKLLTVNHLDNELNNLINNQFSNLNSQKDVNHVKMNQS